MKITHLTFFQSYFFLSFQTLRIDGSEDLTDLYISKDD